MSDRIPMPVAQFFKGPRVHYIDIIGVSAKLRTAAGVPLGPLLAVKSVVIFGVPAFLLAESGQLSPNLHKVPTIVAAASMSTTSSCLPTQAAIIPSGVTESSGSVTSPTTFYILQSAVVGSSGLAYYDGSLTGTRPATPSPADVAFSVSSFPLCSARATLATLFSGFSGGF